MIKLDNGNWVRALDYVANPGKYDSEGKPEMIDMSNISLKNPPHGGNVRPGHKNPPEVKLAPLNGMPGEPLPEVIADWERQKKKDKIRNARRITMTTLDLLIKRELEVANEVYPAFASMHEGYAVLLEEMEETEDALNYTKVHFDYLWRLIRSDRATGKQIREVKKSIMDMIEEAIQVGAMLDKMLPLVEGKE